MPTEEQSRRHLVWRCLYRSIYRLFMYIVQTNKNCAALEEAEPPRDRPVWVVCRFFKDKRKTTRCSKHMMDQDGVAFRSWWVEEFGCNKIYQWPCAEEKYQGSMLIGYRGESHESRNYRIQELLNKHRSKKRKFTSSYLQVRVISQMRGRGAGWVDCSLRKVFFSKPGPRRESRFDEQVDD